MELISPAALWYLGLVALLLILALRRRRHGQLVVSNLYLWRAVEQPEAVKLRPQRPRRNWLIFLQAALMACMVAALAGPMIDVASPSVAFIMDASPSMSAREGAGTRLDLARARALEVLATLPSRTSVRLVRAGGAASDVGSFRAGDPRLHLALASLESGPSAAALDAAVKMVEGADGHGTAIYVFSDSSRGTHGDKRVRRVPVGSPAGNLAIAAVTARRSTSNPSELQILATVRNYSDEVRETEVEVNANGRLLERRRIVVAPNGHTAFTLDAPGLTGSISARLLSSDALEIDDRRVTVAPDPRRDVLLIGTTNRFLEAALRSDPAINIARSSADASRGNRGTEPYDLIVCDGCGAIPAGVEPVLLVAPAPHEDARQVPLAISHSEHPVTAGVVLADLFTPSIAGNPRVQGQILVRAGGAPAVIASERDNRRIVELRLNLDDSTLPLNVAFPVLISNAVNWLTGASENAASIPAGTDLNPVIDGESDLRAIAQVSESAASDAAPWNSKAAAIAPVFLVAGLVLLLGEWFYRRRSGRAFDAVSVACRVTVAAALLLSLAQVRIPFGDGPLSVAFVLDRSDSIAPSRAGASLDRVRDMAGSMKPDDRAALLAFAADAIVERPLADRFAVSKMTSRLRTSQTDIERAIDAAVAALPSNGSRRVVLMSDGRQTNGDAMRAASAAAAANVPVDVVAFEAQGPAEAMTVTHVAAPDLVRIGEPYALSIDVEGPPRAEGRVEMAGPGQPAASIPIVLDGHGLGNVVVSLRHEQAGLHSLRVGVGDEGHTAGVVVAAAGEPHVLYVSERRDSFLPLVHAAKFRATTLSPGQLPRSPEPLAKYDAIVLDDIPSEQLDEAQIASLVAHVNGGAGGLLVLGSPRSLNPAGYPATALGAALPVDLRPKGGKRAPSVAFVIVFDKSGSMADAADGLPKIELARQSVLRVLDVIPPSDMLGVVAFADAPEIVAPIAANHDTIELTRRLSALAAGGATAIGPAVETAIGLLKSPAAAAASRHHVLLVSDGRTSASDADHLRKAVEGRAISLSVVALAADADRALLSRLAENSGGRAYFPEDVRELPRLVAREAARASSGWHVGERFAPRGLGHPVLSGIDPSGLPYLHGYVVSAPKPVSETILQSHLGDPVLASWRFGLGRVALFASDLRLAEGNATQRASMDRIWTQALRSITRQPDDRSLAFTEEQAGDGVRLKVEAVDPSGAFLNGLDVRADIRSPDGSTHQVALEPSAPGRYEGFLRLDEAGSYSTTVTARSSDGTLDRRLIRGFYRTSGESRASGADDALLHRIARTTGGRVLKAGSSPFTDSRPPRLVDLSPWLLTMALWLFFLDALRWRRFNLATLRQWSPGFGRSPSRRAA